MLKSKLPFFVVASYSVYSVSDLFVTQQYWQSCTTPSPNSVKRKENWVIVLELTRRKTTDAKESLLTHHNFNSIFSSTVTVCGSNC